ncbi:MAG: methylmalonyl-CoA carboxyltransferase [Candidatus Aegiribacteria sp. MLS_C]|nr:MAG: methylmalonyl-CoA carboxyltransferase [Candidatus Aegiribacteria sp. MLS_C]
MDTLDELRAEARAGGGEDKTRKRHEEGRLTARERLDVLLDKDSFNELGMFVTHDCHDFGMEEKKFLGDGVVTGYGTVHGRLVYVISEDFTVLGGSLSKKYAEKIALTQSLALKNGAPMINLKDSGGARIQEGIDSLAGYGMVFMGNVRASGVIPQISVIMGPCAGGAVYSPALTDFVFMVDSRSYMFLTGPDVIREVTHEEVTFEELGGAAAHNSKSGVAHFRCDSEEQALSMVRELLTYLPQNNMEDPPVVVHKKRTGLRGKLGSLVKQVRGGGREEALERVLPDNQSLPYDMKRIIAGIVDEDSFFEVHRHFAPSIIVGFGRLEGMTIGIVANQPAHLAGVLDTLSSAKAARFVRFCDSFNIPLLVLEDAPGFLPGVSQEHTGVIKEGAKLLYAFCEATVPRITVVIRKAYGGAYIAMNSKQIGADLNFAWPTAQIAVMGAEGAVKILFRRQLASSPEPEDERRQLVDQYNLKFSNPYVSASKGYIDEVIKPSETRSRLIAAFSSLRTKLEKRIDRKHGNMPL